MLKSAIFFTFPNFAQTHYFDNSSYRVTELEKMTKLANPQYQIHHKMAHETEKNYDVNLVSNSWRPNLGSFYTGFVKENSGQNHLKINFYQNGPKSFL